MTITMVMPAAFSSLKRRINERVFSRSRLPLHGLACHGKGGCIPGPAALPWLADAMGILDRFFSRKQEPSASGIAGLPDNSKLVKAMVKLGQKDSEKNRRNLHAQLVQSTLIVATTEDISQPAPKKKTKKKTAKKAKKKSKAKSKKAAESVDDGEGTSLKIVKDESGDTVLPVFTDDESFLAWYKEGSPFVALPAKDVFALVLEHDLAKIAINPAGPIWGVLSQGDIQRLLMAGEE